MAYQLLALDMDGTLLTSDKRVSPRTREALEQLSATGTPIAFCTGRCMSELMDYPSELPFIRYGVLSSGAVVYDFAAQQILEVHPLETKTLVSAIELALPEQPMVHVMSVSASVARAADIRDMSRYGMGVYQGMFERICTRTDDLAGWAQEHPGEVVKLNFYHRDEQSRLRTRTRIEDARLALSLADAEQTSLECSPLGVTKGRGLQALATHLGIALADAVAIGDGGNDTEALSVVGMPVAMGNATEAIRHLAKLTVADNDHDGVAEAVERLFSCR